GIGAVQVEIHSHLAAWTGTSAQATEPFCALNMTVAAPPRLQIPSVPRSMWILLTRGGKLRWSRLTLSVLQLRANSCWPVHILSLFSESRIFPRAWLHSQPPLISCKGRLTIWEREPTSTVISHSTNLLKMSSRSGGSTSSDSARTSFESIGTGHQTWPTP